MYADSVIDAVVEILEQHQADGSSLADQLRRSYDREYGTCDGFLVSKLESVIREVLDQRSDEEVKLAWNELAEIEACDLLKEGEVLGGPSSDLFINRVLDAIQK